MIRILLDLLALVFSARASGAARVDLGRADGVVAGIDKWLMCEQRDDGKLRFSQLDQVNAASVGQLGLE
jgi:hypothetical protein